VCVPSLNRNQLDRTTTTEKKGDHHAVSNVSALRSRLNARGGSTSFRSSNTTSVDGRSKMHLASAAALMNNSTPGRGTARPIGRDGFIDQAFVWILLATNLKSS